MKTTPTLHYKVALLLCALIFNLNLKSQTSCTNALSITTASVCNYQSFTTTTDQMWFKFIAQSKDVNISLLTTKFGLNATHIHNITLYSGSCGFLNYMTDDELPFETNADRLTIDLNASGLIIGNTYFIKANRKAVNNDCDKATCKAAGSTSPTGFNLCVENINVLVPLDFGLELPTLPHSYEQNRGQLKDPFGNPVPQIKMFTKSVSPAVYIADNFTSFVFEKVDTIASTIDTTHRVDMTLSGSNSNTRIFKTEQKVGFANYYLAHIPQGITGNKSFSRAVINDIYPKIDLQYYSNAEGVKLYYIVHPGANASQIKMKFTGASSTSTLSNGGLNIKTILGNLSFEKAHVYKINPANNIVPMPVSGSFIKVGADEYSIFLQNDPSNKMPIVIQIDRGHSLSNTSNIQNIDWSTFYGGSNSEALSTSVHDIMGNLYMGGTTNSTDFPVLGANTMAYGGNGDAAIVKFNKKGVRQWATYYGGPSLETVVKIDIDSLSNKIYMSGLTKGNITYPTTQPSGAFVDNTFNGNEDIYIMRVDSMGLLNWATLYGGVNYDQPFDMGVDKNQNVFIVGSHNLAAGFPLVNKPGAYNSSVGRGLIIKFNTSLQVDWATSFGYNNTAGGDIYTLDFDNQNSPIISGRVYDSIPILAYTGAYNDATFNGATADLFVTSFDPTTYAMNWSTYLGGNAFDAAYTSCKTPKLGNGGNKTSILPNDNLYYLVQTFSTNFPKLATGTQFYDSLTSSIGNQKYQIVKFNLNTKNMTWSTGFRYSSLTGCVVDANENLIVISASADSTYILKNKPGYYYDNNISWSDPNNKTDCGYAIFSSNDTLIHSSYIGGSGSSDYLNTVSYWGGYMYLGGRSNSGQSSTTAWPLVNLGGNPPAWWQPLIAK